MKFKVGDVVEYCGVKQCFHGEQATVMAVVWKYATRDVYTKELLGPGWRYRLDRDVTSCGTTLFEETALRKRRPPEERGSWSEIEKLTNWNPTRVHA